MFGRNKKDEGNKNKRNEREEKKTNKDIENIEEMQEEKEIEKEDLEVIKGIKEEGLEKKVDKAKVVVIPGEIVSTERKKLGEHVFVEGGNIRSDSLGLLISNKDYVGVVPLEGKYDPKPGDIVVGVVVSENYAGYMVELNSFQTSFISKKEFRDPLKPGSIVSARVSGVDELNEIDISQPRVFYGGEVLVISPVKVPRIIGKNGSMLNTIKEGTNSNILVGRNGLIWIKGGNTKLTVDAIRKIEREAHKSNLTNKIAEYIKSNANK